jgi:GntR family transcriptional regulator
MAISDALLSPRPATRRTLYSQVREQLLARIRSGEWSAGENLPNEYVLSSEFDVSIGTVRRAVTELEANGVLVREQGRGTYVAGRGPAALQDKFSALRGIDGERITTTYELVAMIRRPAAPAELMSLSKANEHGVVEIMQCVEAAGRPIGVEQSVLPASLFPKLETQLRFGQHLYPVFADYGFLITRVEDTIGVEIAPAALAAKLSCPLGAPLLHVTRHTVALDGEVVERRSSHYLPDRVRYLGASRRM